MKKINWKSVAITALLNIIISVALDYFLFPKHNMLSFLTLKSIASRVGLALAFGLLLELFIRPKQPVRISDSHSPKDPPSSD